MQTFGQSVLTALFGFGMLYGIVTYVKSGVAEQAKITNQQIANEKAEREGRFAKQAAEEDAQRARNLEVIQTLPKCTDKATGERVERLLHEKIDARTKLIEVLGDGPGDSYTGRRACRCTYKFVNGDVERIMFWIESDGSGGSQVELNPREVKAQTLIH